MITSYVLSKCATVTVNELLLVAMCNDPFREGYTKLTAGLPVDL